MTSQRLSGARILIVDDDEDILSSIDLAMRAEGAKTMTSKDGSDAISACQNHKPEVVILDMMLPRASGFLVLEKIKHSEDAPIVVMITANQGRRHQAYAEAMGIDAYLIKPVALSRLVHTVATLREKASDENGDAASEQPAAKTNKKTTRKSKES